MAQVAEELKDGQTLADILHERTAEHSLRRIAADMGDGTAPQTLVNIRQNQIRTFPTPKRLEALARTLRLPVAAIVLATARQLGMRVEDVSMLKFAKDLDPRVDELDEFQQKELQKLIKSYVDTYVPKKRKRGRAS